MRKSKLIVAAALSSVLAVSSAGATTTSHLVNKGTAVELSLGSSLPTTQADCNIDVSVFMTAATSVEHVGSTQATGAGMQTFLQVVDSCMGTVEFGSVDAALASGALTVTSKQATLKGSFVVVMSVFDPNFNFITTRNRTLGIPSLVFDAVGTDSSVSKFHTRFRFPNFSSVSDGQSVEKQANVTGTLTLDGQTLLPNPSSAFTASFDTSHSVSVTIIK